ncbi:MAG: hypothetical protein J1E64_08575 [Acetatifactor sp.]|nr:hypothetical protein [Acetatifactor sp.]
MGKISNVMNHYFSDNQRFADLFNGVCFQGEAVVKAEELSEASEVYHEVAVNHTRKRCAGNRAERIRDVRKMMKSGGTLRILALENQELIDYAMPFRCMQYDTMEYGKQLNQLKKKNIWEGRLKTQSEIICKLRQTDHIVPVYTLCLYHGTEKWDGPRSMWDMMDFGKEWKYFQKIFNDYPMRLYCINELQEQEALKVFQTEVGTLFRSLQYRKDREGLKHLLQNDPDYRQVDADTLEVMSVMLELPSVWGNRIKYQVNCEGEKEEYDMCQAIREWSEEERNIGRREGLKAGIQKGIQTGIKQGEEEKTFTIVKNMLQRGMADKDIIAIAECDGAFIDRVRSVT